LSPSIVSVYSTVISLPISFRTAEKLSVPSFSFTSLSGSSFWSGQLIVPASLSPSFLIVKVDVRCCPPISYSHFHVPTGSTLSAAPARPQSPSANAIERIAFIIASENEMGKGSGLNADRHQPLTAILWMPRPLVRPQSSRLALPSRNVRSRTTRSLALARLRRHREAFLNPRLPQRRLAGGGSGRLIAVEVE